MPAYRDPTTGKFAKRPEQTIRPRQSGKLSEMRSRAKSAPVPLTTPEDTAPAVQWAEPEVIELSATEKFRRLVMRARLAPPTAAQTRAVARRRAANKVARASRKVNRS